MRGPKARLRAATRARLRVAGAPAARGARHASPIRPAHSNLALRLLAPGRARRLIGHIRIRPPAAGGRHYYGFRIIMSINLIASDCEACLRELRFR
jgi:hypothetical protein